LARAEGPFHTSLGRRHICRASSSTWVKLSFKTDAKAANQKKEGGPSYYVLKQSRLGDALIDVVRRALRESHLTHTKAAKLLGVSPSSVEPLIRRCEAGPPPLAREER
jgi:transcriptional regulator with GAF, ATPase, and Fis domain